MPAFEENLKLCDSNVAINELMLYKRAGGCSLVDMILLGIGRDPLTLRKISNATGVNVLTSTRWYVAASWSRSSPRRSKTRG